VGIGGVLHPEQVDKILAAQERACGEGIDFRTKEFLGFYEGKLYGQYKYSEACSLDTARSVLCRTSELIIGPDGKVYRCHHDLYENYPAIGDIGDAEFRMTKEFRRCNYYGYCNPCDIKIKTNRLQQFGHTSISIKFPKECGLGREVLVK